MEGYSYINIFDTKGIEYLVIIAFLLLLIPFSVLIERKSSLRQEVKKAWNFLSHNALNIPQGIFFSKHHTWVHLDRSGLAKVGLDHLMLGITGDMKINPLRYSNEMIKKGDVLAEIGMNGKRLRVYSPITGQIVKSNDLAGMNGRNQTEHPMFEAWIYEVKPTNWKEETSGFYLAEEASAWFKAELDRLKDFLTSKANRDELQPAMLVLQDGGELANVSLDEFPAQVWHDFQKEFLEPEENTGQTL